jgi:hypothetical protein
MQITDLQYQARLAFDREVAKRNIKQQMTSRLTVQHNSGVFVVDSNLITFLNSWDDKELILLDAYDTPIKITRLELLDVAKKRYQEIMNEWVVAYDELKSIRSGKNV